MSTRRRYTLSVLLAFALVAMLAAQQGCQQDGAGATTGATTRPSLATLTTQADAALDAAVNSITIGRQLGVIPDAEFNAYVVPAVMAARSATKAMEAAAQKGDQSTWQTASDAATAALMQLQPILARVQDAQTKVK